MPAVKLLRATYFPPGAAPTELENLLASVSTKIPPLNGAACPPDSAGRGLGLKGRHSTAQGNALGSRPPRMPQPCKGATAPWWNSSRCEESRRAGNVRHERNALPHWAARSARACLVAARPNPPCRRDVFSHACPSVVKIPVPKKRGGPFDTAALHANSEAVVHFTFFTFSQRLVLADLSTASVT